MFKVKEIWWEIEYIIGKIFIKLIIKIIKNIILNKNKFDLFFFSIFKIFFLKLIFFVFQ